MAINGYGNLPRGFDHVKTVSEAPKKTKYKNRYYFYTNMRAFKDDFTSFDPDEAKSMMSSPKKR